MACNLKLLDFDGCSLVGVGQTKLDFRNVMSDGKKIPKAVVEARAKFQEQGAKVASSNVKKVDGKR